jgi:hypothetical protein
MQCGELRDGFRVADPCAFLIAQVFDLPFDQIQRIDASHRLVRGGVLLALRVGQRFERFEEASPRVCIILLAR